MKVTQVGSIIEIIGAVIDVEFKNKFIFEAVNELVKTNKVKISEIESYVSKLDNLKTLKRITE